MRKILFDTSCVANTSGGMEIRMKKDAIIFDMDGTLWDAAQQILNSWNHVITELKVDRDPITMEELESMLGKTMDNIAVSLFPFLQPERAIEVLDRCGEYENAYLRENGGKLYEGLEDTLKILQKDYDLYIVSNCQSGYIEAFLEHYRYQKYFKDIECFGNTKQEKADNILCIIERNGLQNPIYVGDTKGDYDSSRKAGISFIYAAYGFGNVTEDVPSIRTITELPELLAKHDRKL